MEPMSTCKWHWWVVLLVSWALYRKSMVASLSLLIWHSLSLCMKKTSRPRERERENRERMMVEAMWPSHSQYQEPQDINLFASQVCSQ